MARDYIAAMSIPTTERRSPERGRHLLRLMRRIAAFCLVIAIALVAGPRVLVYLGVLGPTAQDRIAEAERAIQTARSYGARPDLPSLARARDQLDTARRLAAQGHDRAAREAAREAVRTATQAQAEALVGVDETERRAAALVKDLDRQVNELEHLYDQLKGKLDKKTLSALRERVGDARRTAAVVFLAYDEKRFRDALAGEPAAWRSLAQTRAELQAAERRGPSSPDAAMSSRDATGAAPRRGAKRP